MKRPAGTFARPAVVASSLLCAVVVLAWGRSYFVSDRVGRLTLVGEWRQDLPPHPAYRSPSGGAAVWRYVYSSRGWLCLCMSRSVHGSGSALWFAEHPGWFWSTEGWMNPDKHETDQRCLPYAVPAAVTAALPLLVLFRRWRSAARAAAGRCPSCGYDCRAMPRGGRCPECGQEMSVSEAPP